MAEAKTARHVPEGYDDEAAFLEEARRRFQEGVDFDRDNREAGVEDLKFFAGEQWSDEDKQLRADRPCLTINRLPQFVAQVVGDIRINRPAIRVRPGEDADKDLAEIREGLIRQIERDNDAQGVYADTGTNQVACGIGNMRIGLKYAGDDTFDRDITIQPIPDPFSVVWDPMSTERTGKDAEFCFVVDEMPRKAFEARWSKGIPSDLTIPDNDPQGWTTKDTVRVTEYWVIKETEVELALLSDGSVVPSDKLPPRAQAVQTRKSVRRTACMYLITGHAILSGPHELPIDRVPIIRAQGWVVNVGDRRIRWGLVRFARDAQRLKNYDRSIFAEFLALAPKAQWLIHESSEGDGDAFREAHDSGETVLPYSGQKPERIDPPPFPAAYAQSAQLHEQDMKDVTGLHDASLGAKSNETSGKAIMARQREGDVASYIYHDNLQAAIKEGGRLVNQLIPMVFDTARTIRVLGEDEQTRVQRINDPSEPKSVDINQGRYDIAIETGPSYSTKRVEAAESLLEFVRVLPQAGQAAADLIARAQDWPMADELAERLEKMVPPEMRPKKEGEPPDPAMAQQQAQQAQQQQAAQEMQMRAADMDLGLKEAQLVKARADAEKAQSEAAKSEFELQQMRAQPVPAPGLPPPDQRAPGAMAA